MKTLAIIPARGGSKGIIRKNLRFFNKKPLIYYSIQNALKSDKIDDVVVTTDSDEIIEYCKRFDIKIRKRPEYLGEDNITLDPVIFDAVEWYEKENGEVSTIITMQPTSPLLSVETLNKAFEKFISENLETLISVEDNTHLEWIEKNNRFVQDYEKRLNRQWLPKKYKETGSFLISSRKVVSKDTRIGKKVGVYIIPSIEAIDIDTEIDWYVAESIAKRIKILFVTSANERIGMGHIYRCITLANQFIGHKRGFLIFDTFEKGKGLLKENNFNYHEINNLNDVSEYLDGYDIIVNDFLDTSLEYMDFFKDKFVINFEDLGEGADKANIVYNALYELSNPKNNHRFGLGYFILNDKILIKSPNKFNDNVENVLITFGGIDQNNLTLKSLKALEKFQNIFVKIILGPGYRHFDELYDYLKQTKISHTVLTEVKDMGREMQNVDLAITSNGRTVYELAAMNIPTISIAQNDRETMHLFSRYSKGIEYLGISCNVDEEKLTQSIEEIITNKEKRYNMYKILSQTKIRQSVNNVKEDIINSFWRWKDEKNNNWE